MMMKLCLTSLVSGWLVVSAFGTEPHPDAKPNSHAPGEVDVPANVLLIVADKNTLPGLVLDETDAVLTGEWQYSTHTPPYVGIGYLHDMKSGKGEKSVTWNPNFSKAGRYEVRVSHCYNVRRATNTPVTIRHAKGETTVRIDQQETPKFAGLFRSLGVFEFGEGKSGSVTISNDGTDPKKVAIADAVQFLPVPSPSPAAAAAAGKKPNVLLIVADDLGFSDLGCYGGEIETPVLDSLAKGGVKLTQFYNTGRCCPSRASILTGHYPHRVGLGHMTQDIGRKGYSGSVSKDAQTIAQVLKPAGYRSFISGKWHLGTDDPTQHGFEEFYGTLVSAKRFWDANHLIRKPDGAPTRDYHDGEFYATDAVTDHALDFLGQARQTPDQPWFLYLAYNAPHFPLHAPKAEIKKYADRYQGGWDELRAERLERMKALGIVAKDTQLTPRSPWWNYGETETGTNPAWVDLPEDRRLDSARRMAIYAAMVDRMDQQIGRVVSDLKKAGEFANTLIIFTSDNGACAEWDPRGFDGKSSNDNVLHAGADLEKMGGPGTYHSAGSGWANVSNTPWRLYKHYNHEGGINSPCIIHWPKNPIPTPKGTIDETPRHIIDLMPTITEVGGAEYSGEIPLPGELMLTPADPNRTLYFEHEGNRAVREGAWKLVALRDQPWELYDFSNLRTEMKDLAQDHPEIVNSLSKKWDTWATENFVTPMPKDYQVKYLKVK